MRRDARGLHAHTYMRGFSGPRVVLRVTAVLLCCCPAGGAVLRSLV